MPLYFLYLRIPILYAESDQDYRVDKDKEKLFWEGRNDEEVNHLVNWKLASLQKKLHFSLTSLSIYGALLLLVDIA